MWKEVAAQIRAHQNFVVTTHIHPEGDAIGSEVALAVFLHNLGKKATIVNSSRTPQNNVFLDPEGEIRVYPGDFTPEILRRADRVIIVDVNNWGHLGPFGQELQRSSVPRMCIDHHQGGDSDIAEWIVRDTTAAAAGVMVYDLIQYMEGEISARIAEAIYTAIITDTGTFRFSNTDERVLRMAADLLTRGVDPFGTHREVFAKTRGAVTLLGSVLKTLATTEDGRIAWIHATEAMFNEAGAEYEDSDGLLDVVRSIRGVEFCLFFKEVGPRRTKVSLRSNGTVDVYAIAQRFGGGGHRMASGMTVEEPLTDAIRRVIAECERSLA